MEGYGNRMNWIGEQVLDHPEGLLHKMLGPVVVRVYHYAFDDRLQHDFSPARAAYCLGHQWQKDARTNIQQDSISTCKSPLMCM